MTQFWEIIEKVQFWAILGPFCPIWAKPDFSQTCGWYPVTPHHMMLTFRPFLAKTNDSILRNYRKSPFSGHFGHFLPKFGQTRFFPQNRALSLLIIYGPLTSNKKSEKTNEPILRRVRYRQDWQTDRRTLIHRTLPASQGSKKRLFKFIIKFTNIE